GFGFSLDLTGINRISINPTILGYWQILWHSAVTILIPPQQRQPNTRWGIGSLTIGGPFQHLKQPIGHIQAELGAGRKIGVVDGGGFSRSATIDRTCHPRREVIHGYTP